MQCNKAKSTFDLTDLIVMTAFPTSSKVLIPVDIITFLFVSAVAFNSSKSVINAEGILINGIS